MNNQLLPYDPSTNTWTNAKCSGEPPSPRFDASTANIHDNVWLYGGRTENNSYNKDLYQLNLCSFVWTKIEATIPNGITKASLTPVSTNQLVLYDGRHQDMHDQNITTWIFDVQSHQFRKHSNTEIHYGWKHTGITGLNSNVIIFGGVTTVRPGLKGPPV